MREIRRWQVSIFSYSKYCKLLHFQDIQIAVRPDSISEALNLRLGKSAASAEASHQ